MRPIKTKIYHYLLVIWLGLVGSVFADLSPIIQLPVDTQNHTEWVSNQVQSEISDLNQKSEGKEVTALSPFNNLQSFNEALKLCLNFQASDNIRYLVNSQRFLHIKKIQLRLFTFQKLKFPEKPPLFS